MYFLNSLGFVTNIHHTLCFTKVLESNYGKYMYSNMFNYSRNKKIKEPKCRHRLIYEYYI